MTAGLPFMRDMNRGVILHFSLHIIWIQDVHEISPQSAFQKLLYVPLIPQFDFMLRYFCVVQLSFSILTLSTLQ